MPGLWCGGTGSGRSAARLYQCVGTVDATAVPTLYSGRVRPSHLVGLVLAGLLALAAAIGTTPVGQEWGDVLVGQTIDVFDYLQGKLS